MDSGLKENESGNAKVSLKKKLLRTPKCAKCRNHGIISNLKGHKKLCCWKECRCPSCHMVVERQKMMASQIAFRRYRKEFEERSYVTYEENLLKKKQMYQKRSRSTPEIKIIGKEIQKKFNSVQNNSCHGSKLMRGQVFLQNNFQSTSSLNLLEVQDPYSSSRECSEVLDIINTNHLFKENKDEAFESEILRKPSADAKNGDRINFSKSGNKSRAKLSFSIEALLSRTN